MATHVDFNDIFLYITTGGFPTNVATTKGAKANFRKAARAFTVQDGRLCHTKRLNDGTEQQLPVIQSSAEVRAIIQEAHEGHGESSQAKAMRSHHGLCATFSILSSRFYWRAMYNDVKAYIRACDACQRTNPSPNPAKPQLHSVPVLNRCMAQVGVDICSLPLCDGYVYLVLSVDYFTKWTEGKPLKDKNAPGVALFLYELICRHGCIEIQINDQGREFVNQISAELHRLMGVEQRVTSAYHPQANGLVERQNRTIKEKLLKVLNGSHSGRVSGLDGVLFAHRTVKHRSTGYSPFYMLYGREAKLPIDVAMGPDVPEDEEFSEQYVTSVVESMANLRRVTHEKASANISQAQRRQKRDYDKRHSCPYQFKSGDKVLLRNLKRADRKGGKSTFPWKGPYVIAQLYSNSTCSLFNASMTKLAQRQNLCNIKPYQVPPDPNIIITVAEPTAACATVMAAWLPHLALSTHDRHVISNGEWLNDSVIDAVQVLLKNQQLDVGGLQSTTLSETVVGYYPAIHPSVQIHYDSSRSHWLTSSSCRNRVEISDSLRSGTMSKSMVRQLFHCYPQFISEGRLAVFVLSGQQQDNSNDCGVFAIANAIEFIADEGNPTSNYEQILMRPHLVTCLESGVMVPFPKRKKAAAKSTANAGATMFLKLKE